MSSQVIFDERAPGLERIAEQVTEISGLPVSITDRLKEFPDPSSDFDGTLAFTCVPQSWIELRAYRPEEVRKFYHESVGDPDLRLPMARCVHGLNEPSGTQTVYLRGYINQEPTLLFVTLLALEKLGGRPRHPIPDDIRRGYSVRITETELEKRCRKAGRQAWLGAAVAIVMLPVLIPLWVLFLFLKLPLGVWYVWRHYGEFTKASK